MPPPSRVFLLPSYLYGRLAGLRRRWYARDPNASRRLARPVVSVGNLTVGGSGKTPIVACVCRLLAGAGERPAVLSRGYGRAVRPDGVTVVQDAAGTRATLDRAGDEPLMLARQLPGTPVLVCEDRYLAGRLAETRLGATVHVLDDGFQHLQLWRDADLVAIDPADLGAPAVVPAGRLREPLESAAAADALIVHAGSDAEARAVGGQLGVATVFRAGRTAGPLRDPTRPGAPVPDGAVFAVAGVARPMRFLEDVARGREVAGSLVFRDHHRYGRSDAARIARAAAAAGAVAIVTTEKDFVRLEPHLPLDLPVLTLPLDVRVEPADAFAAWLLGRLRGAHASHA